MVAFAQRRVQGQGEGPVGAHGAVVALAGVGPGVDVEFFACVQAAVAVAVDEHTQCGPGLALALDAQTVFDAGDAITPCTAVAGCHQHERLRGGDDGVDGQREGGGGQTAVACAVDRHSGDLVSPVGQGCGRAGVKEGPGVVGIDPGAAQQHTVGIEPNGGGVLVGCNGSGERQTVGASHHVVGGVVAVIGVAPVIALVEVGHRGCAGRHRVDGQNLQPGAGAFLGARVAESHDAGLDGAGIGIQGARGAASAGQRRLGLQPQPALGQIFRRQGDAVDFGVALQQTNHIADLHGGGVQADFKNGGQLLGDVVGRTHAGVGGGRDAHVAWGQRVGLDRRDHQLVGAAVKRDVARQVHGLHRDLVSSGAGAQGLCTGQGQAPRARAGVQRQAPKSGVVQAADVDAASGFVAVGLAVDQHKQAVGVGSVVAARQGGGGSRVADVVQQHGGSHGCRFVNHHRGGAAGGAPQAGPVLLDDAQVVPAQSQLDVGEIVFAGAVGGDLTDQLLVFQQAVVVAVVVQTHHGCRVGKTREEQTRVVAGHAIVVQATGVDRGQQAGGPQLRGGVGIKGDHQRQRAVADVARFVGRSEGEHPCGGVVSRTCVLERPGSGAEHLRQAQRSIAVKQLHAAGTGGHRAVQGEVFVDHRDAIGAAAAAVVHALEQGGRGHEGLGVGVGRDRVDLQAGQYVHAAHVAGDVHHIGANEVTVAGGP